MENKIFEKLSSNQFEILKLLNKTTFNQPGRCNLIAREKGTRIYYLKFLHWLTSNFRCHYGMDDHCGMDIIFTFKDLPQIYHIMFADKVEINTFVDNLFEQLMPYDNIIFEFDEESNSINVPYLILLLKFLRELLCNPIVATYNMRYRKGNRGSFIDDIIRIFSSFYPDLKQDIYVPEKGYIKKEYKKKFIQRLKEINLYVAEKYPSYHLMY